MTNKDMKNNYSAFNYSNVLFLLSPLNIDKHKQISEKSNHGSTFVSFLSAENMKSMYIYCHFVGCLSDLLQLFSFFFKVGAGSKAIHRQKRKHEKSSPNGGRPTSDPKYRCHSKSESGRRRSSSAIQSAQIKRASLPFDSL